MNKVKLILLVAIGIFGVIMFISNIGKLFIVNKVSVVMGLLLMIIAITKLLLLRR